MSRLPVGARAVRLLARLVAFAYPQSFRQSHAHAFADVAQHLWEHESAATSRLRATFATARVLLADTITGGSVAWMAAVRDDESPASLPRLMARRLGRWMGGGWQDLRHAARAAQRRPGFALLVILTLGLGIGTSAAAYDALDRTVLRALPFRDSDRLVMLALQEPKNGYWTSPDLELLGRWRASARRLEQIEIHRESSIVWHADDGAERLSVLGVSGGLPGMLGIRPVAGRLLQPADADAGAAAVVMVTEQAWRARFGADPGLVGRTLPLGATPRPTTVVGIWPAGARLQMRDVPDLINVLPAGKEYGRGSLVHILARMTPGSRNQDVEHELAALMPPAESAGSTYVPDAASPAELSLGGPYIQGVWLVFAGGLALLVVAIANAGHLLLGRASTRAHELGVRLALGGSQLRLLRLFLAEGAIFVAGGLAAGIGVMIGLERVIRYYEPRLFMTMDGAGLDGRVFWFIAAVALVSTLACAAAPLLRAGSRDIRGAIDRANRTRGTARASRAMTTLVVAQAALAVLLVCGAFVMVRSFRNLMAVDTGIAIDQLAAISVAPPAARYPTPDSRAAYFRQVEEALHAIPTVTGVTTSGMPLLSTSIQTGLPYLDGEDKPQAEGERTALGSVPVNYFDVTGVRIVAGRGFREDDNTTVAVVNESFAKSRGGDVLGRKVFSPMGKTPFEIVGVVRDVKVFGVADDEARFAIYFPEIRRAPDSFMRYFVRSSGDPATVVGEARRRITAIDRTVPMFTPETGPEVVRRQTSLQRLVAALLVGLATMGFGLALAGVYGSVALEVSRRTREIGVRMALGATRERVMAAVIGGGLRPVIAGGVVGLAVAWIALPFIEALLYQVRPRDPWSTVSSIGLVAAAAAVSAWVPARRASRIDPAVTLRQ